MLTPVRLPGLAAGVVTVMVILDVPPYEMLDPILEAYVERYETPSQIVAEYGFPAAIVEHIVRLVERTEYKRQQAAPVLKVTPKSFGMGRRFPIAARVQV